MEQERSVDRLARIVIGILIASAIIAGCWFLRHIVIYILAAGVVSLIGRPITQLLGKVSIKGWTAPQWLRAILALLLIILLFLGIVTEIIPVIGRIVSDISSNFQKAQFSAGGGLTLALAGVNDWIISTFPMAGEDFKIDQYLVSVASEAFDISKITGSVGSLVGSVANVVSTVAVGVFCIMFISFFFLKDEGLFKKIVGSVVPDKFESEVIRALGEIETMLSRYFVGLIIEVVGVATVVFFGLMICGLGASTSLGIAFMAGLLNVIPYLGPWIGAGIGTILGLVLKYSAAAVVGTSLNFWPVAISLLAVFMVAQGVDNYLLQPLIYSASLKTHPLEIFVVLIIAGHIGGILGMVVAIPCYIVLRVVASRFFLGFKPVRRLVGQPDEFVHMPDE
ncbi:MAG: AI-2E family transporter [Bacteroidales bacterium]|nr:AI-2E family transporter [Bacteroidales bacterium]